MLIDGAFKFLLPHSVSLGAAPISLLRVHRVFQIAAQVKLPFNYLFFFFCHSFQFVRNNKYKNASVSDRTFTCPTSIFALRFF
jgi:hypothetical protein